MKDIDRLYPSTVPSMWGWLGAIVFVLIIGVLAFTLGFDAPWYAAIISVLAGGGIIVISVFGFMVQYEARSKMREGVCGVSGKIVYRVDGVEGIDRHNLMRRLIEDLLDYDLGDILTKKMQTFEFNVKPSNLEPVTFVSFKPPGEVRMMWKGFLFRAMELQKGRTVDVEWKGDVILARKLVLHGLAHVLLSEANPRLSDKEQHDIIERSQVENIDLAENVDILR